MVQASSCAANRHVVMKPMVGVYMSGVPLIMSGQLSVLTSAIGGDLLLKDRYNSTGRPS